ncbi:MAG TPA: helix-turn-helix domain-containing protein [Nocardioides sp.]|nr:helix-turn-helix domain-containing protein [Nocardioides sp.]
MSTGATTGAAPAVDPAQRRRLHPDERRELILETASRLFEVRPYADVSTVEIAREAGIARGLLNHYFKDKRGLYLEVVRRSVLLPMLEALPARAATASPDRVDIAVDWFLDSVEQRAASYFNALGSEGMSRDPEVTAILEEADDLAARRVLELMGLDAEDDLARATIRCYGGMAKATVREWIRQQTLTREQAHDLLRDVLLFVTSTVLAR